MEMKMVGGGGRKRGGDYRTGGGGGWAHRRRTHTPNAAEGSGLWAAGQRLPLDDRPAPRVGAGGAGSAAAEAAPAAAGVCLCVCVCVRRGGRRCHLAVNLLGSSLPNASFHLQRFLYLCYLKSVTHSPDSLKR